MTTTKILPLIHLNGSGMNNLLFPAEAAQGALNTAANQLRAMAPHGRDYYPLGDAAFEAAAQEHVLLCAKLAEVLDAVEAHLAHLYAVRNDLLARTGR
jgi:hypothetical protein